MRAREVVCSVCRCSFLCARSRSIFVRPQRSGCLWARPAALLLAGARCRFVYACRARRYRPPWRLRHSRCSFHVSLSPLCAISLDQSAFSIGPMIPSLNWAINFALVVIRLSKAAGEMSKESGSASLEIRASAWRACSRRRDSETISLMASQFRAP